LAETSALGRAVADAASTAKPPDGFLERSGRSFSAKLDQIDSVAKLDDLRVPPGNRLHQLMDDLAGFHAIRVNEQYRIIFRFEGEHAFDVRCTDYH
jgi:proteic killer suppression protein